MLVSCGRPTSATERPRGRGSARWRDATRPNKSVAPDGPWFARAVPHDSAGAPGVVARLHDDGLEVRTDDGGTLRLRHHDMAGHGDVLAANPRVFVQLRWGYLCTGRLGITVVTAADWKPCRPRPDWPRE